MVILGSLWTLKLLPSKKHMVKRLTLPSVQEGDCVSTIRLEDGQEIEVHIRCRFKQGKRSGSQKVVPMDSDTMARDL